jgi:hypothetical protein
MKCTKKDDRCVLKFGIKAHIINLTYENKNLI